MLTQEGISNAVSCNDVRVLQLESIDSTNNEAKRLLAEGLIQRAVIIADEQTEGRGRNGHSYYSPADSGLYMSIVIHPNAFPKNTVSITPRVAVAVTEAIEKIAGISTGIKWVNDIYYNGKKAGGILTEASSDFRTGIVKSVIIGVGLNLRTHHFPHKISDIATTLNIPDELTEKLAAEIANNIFEITDNLSDDNYLEKYRQRSIVIGKEINYCINGEEHTAIAESIDEYSGLVIRKTDGTSDVLRSGEISIRLS